MKRLSLTTRNENLSVRQKGAAAVEFAIVISLLVMIIGGILEFGRVLWYYDALTKATRDGARYLSTAAQPISVNDATVRGMVEAAATEAGLPGFTGSTSVTISCEGGCATPSYVTVTINAYKVDFGSWFAIPLPTGDWFLTPHTTMRYMCATGATTSC